MNIWTLLLTKVKGPQKTPLVHYQRFLRLLITNIDAKEFHAFVKVQASLMEGCVADLTSVLFSEEMDADGYADVWITYVFRKKEDALEVANAKTSKAKSRWIGSQYKTWSKDPAGFIDGVQVN